MAVKGIFTSDAGGLAERPEALSSTILREGRGYGAPLFAISSGMPNTDCDQTMVSWHEEGIMNSRCAITAMPTPDGATIVVEDSSWFTENSIFMVESSGEYVLVLGITGNTITVQRGLAGTGVTPIVLGGDEEALQLIGNAFEEGSERPSSVATSPYPRTNITQIFRNAWDITGTAKASKYRFGSRVEKNKGTASLRHAEDIERSLIWGKQHVGVVNNKPFRQMDGVLSQLRTNFFASPGGGLTRRSLTDFIERIFSKRIEGQPNERVFWCGNVAIRALQEICYRYSEYQISLREKAWGIDVQTFVTPFGSATLMIHPLMNDSPVWSNQMYAFHPGAMEMCWLRRTEHKSEGGNGMASDLRDAEAGVFTSELTCKYMLEQTGGVMMDIEVDHYVR